MPFIKSTTVLPVEFNIFAMLLVEGHLGCPYFDQRLLLLNVVASIPDIFANLEQDIFCIDAKLSIACHISLCVMFDSFFYDIIILFLKRYVAAYLYEPGISKQIHL